MAVTINASTSAGLVMTSDLSGTLTLQQNGVSLPNGGVAPAFSVNTVTAQSFTSSTFTKVQYNVKTFDTNTNYDAVTNYRFTPTVSGYYQINANVGFAGNAVGFSMIAIYKNGSLYTYGSGIINNTTVGGICTVSSLLNCNGSTDFIEIYAWQSSGGALVLQTGNGNNTFSGCLVRGA